MEKQKSLIYDAYNIIGNLTPIKADCGKLCGKACCVVEGAGMLLFPGEESILGEIRRFRIEEMEYMDAPNMKLLLCDSNCNRDFRPLACRIFPVAPKFLEKKGVIAVQPDIRGRRMCPIWDLTHVDEIFIKTVRKVFEMLAKDEKLLSFMRLISDEQYQLRRFYIGLK